MRAPHKILDVRRFNLLPLYKLIVELHELRRKEARELFARKYGVAFLARVHALDVGLLGRELGGGVLGEAGATERVRFGGRASCHARACVFCEAAPAFSLGLGIMRT